MTETLFSDWNATTTMLLFLGIGFAWEFIDLHKQLQEMHSTMQDINSNTRDRLQ